MIIKRLLHKKSIIIILLILFILLYTFYLERSKTSFSIVLDGILGIINDEYTDMGNHTYSNVIEIFNSMYFQIPAQFFSTLFNLYITSFILFICLKLQQKIGKKELGTLTYSGIVSIFFISLYVVMMNYFIQSIIMIATGSSVDILDDQYYIPFWAFFTLLQVGIVIYGVYKKYKIVTIPIILYTCILSFQLGIQIFI